jgi:hypothetical protein
VTVGDRLTRFVAFSADVTGFTEFELRGTGQASEYLSTAVAAVGEQFVDELLDAHEAVVGEAGGKPAALDDLLRRDIFSDEKLGPIARSVVKVWYVGIWYELPRAWREAFGAREKNQTFMVSATAYTEGLLWPAIGANPNGAKAPGFASWAEPPQIPAGSLPPPAPAGSTGP